jgi:hypothetical protein
MTERPARFAVKLATGIERRRFMRHSAQAAFIGIAGLAAGTGLQLWHPPKAFAAACDGPKGLGCPSGTYYGPHPCGPSPCCNWWGSNRCNCESSPGKCKSHATDSYCNGIGMEVYGTGCWGCAVIVSGCLFTTTCCDCHYSSTGGPACNPGSGYYAKRCISWNHQLIHC